MNGRDTPGAGVVTHELVHVFHADGHDVAALSGVSLTVGSGELVGLLGPSGSGKSTLLLACAALLRPTAGRLLLDGTDIVKLPDVERDRLRTATIGMVLQGASRNVLPYLTIAENILLAQRAARRAGGLELPEPAAVLDLVGLTEPDGLRAEALRPGSRQLLALACGIAHRPRLLLADEPTSRLAAAERDRVLTALGTLNDRWGTTVVLVTHDPEVAAALPRTVTIRDGRIGAEGRLGKEYSVITADGSVSLPAELLADHPPGTLLRIERSGEGLLLSPVGAESSGAEISGTELAGEAPSGARSSGTGFSGAASADAGSSGSPSSDAGSSDAGSAGSTPGAEEIG